MELAPAPPPPPAPAGKKSALAFFGLLLALYLPGIVAGVLMLFGGGLALNLYRPLEAPGNRLGFKVYRAGEPVALSTSLPMLEHMGLRVLSEQPYEVGPERGDPFWIHDFQVELVGSDEIEAEEIAPLFEDAFSRVVTGAVESDDFNRLVLLASLSADEITVLRAYAKYMRQIGFALSQAFIESTLASHPRIARMLVQLFKLRFEKGPECPPGCFFFLRLPGVGEKPFSPAQDVEPVYLVRIVGPFTRALAQLKPGDPIYMRGPYGRGFPEPQPDGPLVLVAGGTGAAPILLAAARWRAEVSRAFFGFSDQVSVWP